MRYKAYNRKTGKFVQVVTDGEKQHFQSTPSTDVFRYVPIESPPPAEKPAEVKAAKAINTTKAKPKRQRKSKTSKSVENDTAK